MRKKPTNKLPPTATHIALPDVSPKGIGRALVRTALDKAPGVGVLTKWHDSIAAVQQEERLALWLEYVRGEHTGDEFKAKIEDGLRGPHAEYVRNAVLESTRAATDALDDAAIPPIARLTNRYLHSKEPDLWTYRDLLALLRSLDREMLDALRTAMAKVDALLGERIVHFVRGSVATEFDLDPDADDMLLVWRLVIPPTRDRKPSERIALSELGRGQAVERLLMALSGSSVGLFSGTERATEPRFKSEIIDILVSVL